MKDLKLVKEENEVSILSNGSSLISQRKLAALLGVNPSTFMNYIRRVHQNVNTINGLDENIAFSASTYFAYESKVSTQKARDFLKLIGAGGIRAYNYHLAGVPLNAAPQPDRPETKLEWMLQAVESEKALLESEKALLESQAERKRIEERFLSVMDKEGAYTFLETSKLLSTHGHSGLGRTTLMHLLRSKGLLLKSNLPAQQQIVNGRFIVKRYYIEDIAKHGTSTLVTPKGFVFISRHINNWLN